MTAASFDAWQEKCLVALSKMDAGSNIEYWALTEDVDIDDGEKPMEGVAIVNGGRIAKHSPHGDIEVNMTMYPIAVSTASGTAGTGIFDAKYTTADTTQPISISADATHQKYRVAILWTEDTTITTAGGATAANKYGMRFVCAGGYITKVKPEKFGPSDPFKVTVTFKAPPFDKSASANAKWESTDDSAVLAALANYTSSAKW